MRPGTSALAGLLLLAACSGGSAQANDTAPASSAAPPSSPALTAGESVAETVTGYQDGIDQSRTAISQCVTVEGFPDCGPAEFAAVGSLDATTGKLATDLSAAPRPDGDAGTLYDATRASVAAAQIQLAAWTAQQCGTAARQPDCAGTARLLSFSASSLADQLDRWSTFAP